MAEVVTDHPQRQRPGRQAPRDRVELDVSTPLAKTVVDALLAVPCFDRAGFTLHVRQPRTLVAAERMITRTRPLIEPTSESFQELEPFSYLTFGWVGRLFSGEIRFALGTLL